MEICPKCESDNLTIIRTPNTHHYAKLVCDDCDRWIRWLPNPHNTVGYDLRTEQIKDLLETDRINDYERRFLNHIKDVRHLTPHQRVFLNNLLAQL